MKTLSTITMATAALLIGSTAALAVPMVGSTAVGQAPILNQNFAGTGGFSLGLGSTGGQGSFELLYTDTGGSGANIGDNIVSQAITPHPAWQPNNTGVSTGAEWISFADSGNGGVVLDNLGAVNGPGQAIATFRITFTTGFLNGHGGLGLWIYGDDTAEAFLSGGDIFGGGSEVANDTTHGLDDGVVDDRQRISILANTSQGTCAAGSIGCQPSEFGFVEMLNLSDNTEYTLEIDMFQIGSGPSGIMFAGGVNSVPEPASIALLGLGLVGVGAAARRRRKKVA